MDIDALSRVFTRPDPGQPIPRAAERPQEAPAAPDPGNPAGEASARSEARAERAAILEVEGGLTREVAEAEAARLHPDPGAPGGEVTPPRLTFTRGELRAIAGEDWSEIADRPEALRALADLLRTGAARARGEVPAHYTQPALCASCGPVWLWNGAPARVLACPWCLSPPAAPVPRPSPDVRSDHG